MRGELEYQSTVFGECPSDYDWDNIKNPVELEFLKRTDILQGTITRLKYNIEMYDYFLTRYILNRVIRDELCGFFTIFLSDLTSLIAVDFSSILENSKLTLRNYTSFCNTNSTLFTYESINDVSKRAKADLKIAEHYFTNYIKKPRDELFAHMDRTLLDQDAVNRMVERVGIATMRSLLQYLVKILSEFWFAYNGKKLCFEFKQGEDYKKLAHTICSAYGDTKFI